LLETLVGATPGVVPFGIDVDPKRIEHARTLHRSAATHFVVGDLFEDDSLWSPERRFALALLMPGRLVEAGPEKAAALRERLWTHCDQVLVYAYGDWLDGAGGVADLARRAGLAVSGPTDTPVALATVLPSLIDEQEVLNGS
jgi:hypothetical protein